jgi:hypothetical protein
MPAGTAEKVRAAPEAAPELFALGASVATWVMEPSETVSVPVGGVLAFAESVATSMIKFKPARNPTLQAPCCGWHEVATADSGDPKTSEVVPFTIVKFRGPAVDASQLASPE